MSSEFDLVEAMKQQAAGMHQNAAVNAASVAQRQKEMEAAGKTSATNLLINALNFAVAFNRSHADRTVEHVLKDADKFVEWFNGWQVEPRK
jgi:hypothetical protein